MVLQVAMFLVTILLLPCLCPVGPAGFIRFTLYAVLLWEFFLLRVGGINAARGAEAHCMAYLPGELTPLRSWGEIHRSDTCLKIQPAVR